MGMDLAQSSGSFDKSSGSSSMRNWKQSVVAFLRDEEGLTVVEYAIAGGLVGLAVITAFTDLGNTVARIIRAIVNLLGGP